MALSLAASVTLLLVVLVVSPLSYLLLLAGNGGGGDARRRRLPPSPRGLPVLGHLHLLGTLPHRALRSLARAHGPVMLLRLGRVPTVVVSSAAGAEEVMRARDLAFAGRPRSSMADRLLYGSRDVAFAPYGEYWRQARRACVVHLLSARRVASFRRVREQEAAALVARVRAGSAGAAAVGLSELLTQYANAVVSRAAFGDESARGLFGGGGRGREQMKVVFTDFQTLIGMQPVAELLPWLGWIDTVRGLDGKIRRTFEALDALLDKVIDDHRRRRRPRNGDDDGIDGDHRDFVDVLLDVNKHDEEYGFQLETNEIKAIILVLVSIHPYVTISLTQMNVQPSVSSSSRCLWCLTVAVVRGQDMFAAGTDTTSAAMEWAMAELVTHPRVMSKLQDEIRAAVGSNAGSVVVGEDHLAQLDYLKAVVKETLRLHAPVALLVPREPVADAEILGYRIPARTRVVINAWAIGRDPATWDDAEEFLPERFAGGSAVDFRGQHFELVPFGAGRRGCPGVGLAEASIEMALASLLYHFDWEAAGGTGPAALDMTEVTGISVHIKSGLTLVAKPRLP
jgi:cytochrome P450